MEERIQKIIAMAGLASRREAERMMANGEVTLNGELVTELGTKADISKDHIKVRGKLLRFDQEKVYILLNKPKGVVSTAYDPEGRPIVTELVRGVKVRLYPVGRLDTNTEGALLLTNDGLLTHKMLAPKTKAPKTYLVKVSGVPQPSRIAQLERGITVDGTRYSTSTVTLVSKGNNSWLYVVLTEGKNHQIRNMFAAIGHPVSKLRRIAFGFLTTKALKIGEWRYLTETEIARLERGDFEPLLPVNPFQFLRDTGVAVSSKERAAFEDRPPRKSGGRGKPGRGKKPRTMGGLRQRHGEDRDDSRGRRSTGRSSRNDRDTRRHRGDESGRDRRSSYRGDESGRDRRSSYRGDESGRDRRSSYRGDESGRDRRSSYRGDESGRDRRSSYRGDESGRDRRSSYRGDESGRDRRSSYRGDESGRDRRSSYRGDESGRDRRSSYRGDESGRDRRSSYRGDESGREQRSSRRDDDRPFRRKSDQGGRPQRDGGYRSRNGDRPSRPSRSNRDGDRENAWVSGSKGENDRGRRRRPSKRDDSSSRGESRGRPGRGGSAAKAVSSKRENRPGGKPWYSEHMAPNKGKKN